MVTKADVPVKGPSVSITNNFYPAMDTISVQDLAVGDVVYVYDSIGETLPMASAIVANTSTPTTIETDQLGNPPGKVYVSFMRGGAESGRREASYSGALMPVSYKVGNGGSISIIEGMNQTLMPGDVVQTVLYGEDPPYIMAVAKAGYRFVRWSDGLMDPDRWDRNVVNAIDVTALFESIPEIYADPVVTDNSKPAEALINGKVENIGKINITKEGNIDVTVITLDPDKFFTQLEAGGNKPIITIKVPTGTEAVEGMINGQIIKSMEMKDAVLELKTDQFAYSLPAAQINIDDILTNIGTEVQPKDITVKISIREADESTAKLMQDIAVAKNYQIVVKPVNFNVVCSSGDKTIEVTKFNGYVERIIAIPEEVDPSKITTGIVLNSDGTFSHIPTSFFNVDGKYYAKINSLTNSTYSVIYRPKTFKDVETHWAKDAVNDMGSRLVIDGIDENNFSPDRDITRAEFAAIMVRVLGLKGGRGDKSFYDVKAADWFSGYVKTAVEYGLIKGYDDGTFKPDAQITREEAMTVIARAMMWTGLKTEFGVDELTTLYTVMNDTDNVAVWAKGAVGACLKNGIVTGRDGLTIAPKASVTRAEVAVMVQRLLKKSKLIN